VRNTRYQMSPIENAQTETNGSIAERFHHKGAISLHSTPALFFSGHLRQDS